MKIGIVGCGLIGGKRASTIKAPHQITGICDAIPGKAENFARTRKLEHIYTSESYEDMIINSGAELIIVCTIAKYLAPITLCAVQHGKHVIVEKPAGICSNELIPIMDAMKEKGVIVKVGFNHRYHPAMLKAKEIIDKNTDKLGPIMFVRGRYGHGGRIGYDREWRADPALSGGGELIDQGVHLIDLSRWFLGDFEEVTGFTDTYFWDMQVDDNAFLSLRKEDGRAAWLHVSCTEWKNLFSFEIYCKYAKLMIDGLGGSYGLERLSYYQMLPQMGPPETTIFEFPMGDLSWELELKETIEAIQNQRQLAMGDIHDAYEALKIVEKINSR